MAKQFETELTQGPQDEETRLDFLWRLLEPQVITRKERAFENRLRQARFPRNDSLDNFDFNFQPGLDRNRVLELATLDFISQGQNLLLAGMSGTGKSHIGIALARLACTAGYSTRYTTSADMLVDLQAALAIGELHQKLKKYTRPQVLLIDEVGLDRAERDATPDAQLFYKVIRPRHDPPATTIITSNIEWDQWGSYLGDEMASVAILDRLIEHGHLITINGPSYRAERHQALNNRFKHADSKPSKKQVGTKPRKISPTAPK